jgi:hypothetical protein
MPKENAFSPPLQVKNKPRDGEMEHAFILESMDCTVANNLYDVCKSHFCFSFLSHFGSI